MYSVDEQDTVVELKHVPQPSVGAPLPIVVSVESKILLAYIIQETSSEYDGTAVRMIESTTPGERLALFEFSPYWIYMFGAPNDEAFEGHPLAARGLKPYGAFRIENSSWLRQLELMNSVHPNHDRERWFEKFSHYVFAFHDSTFECVANNFTISEHRGTLESLLPVMRSRLQ